MDLGTVLSVAQTLFAALQCSELRDFCNTLGYKTELEKLECTVKIVKAVLEEAESKEELPPQAQLYVDQLNDVIYDADDLLDEFVTLARRKNDLIKEGKISEKLRLLFSRFNPLATAHKMSQGVKEIRKRLDEIACEHTKFGFKLDSKPILRRREETCSYVDAQDIVGREEDVEQIVHKLLDPDHVQQGVSCLAIVGIGGLGKTTLAQLIFNDPRVQREFPLRSWTCVSDQDQKDLDKKLIACKVLDSLTGTNNAHLSMESLQKQLQNHVAGKKCLIVLDDLWNESRRQLVDMAKLLKIGLRGSWIIVTTRSELTASILGGENVHKLKGLSEEDSWKLFEIAALGQGGGQENTTDLVEIGHDIVKRCANVPLAIRVVGSLLYGHTKEKWVSFQNRGLGTLKDVQNYGVGPILKLSYHHLESPLKTCFIYCAIFPKDHVIHKQMLINLWMAHDYIVPLEEGQSVEDTGNEYFSILVRRCFLQDFKRDEYGEIISCKIHDLMHDLAQEVAEKEICATDSFMTNMDSRIRHMSYRYCSEDVQEPFAQSRIRTCLCTSDWGTKISVGKLLRKWTCLRALDLGNSGIKRLPSAIGKLLHLRYIDLSRNELEVLPNSIAKLHNLQTINLNACFRLEVLRNDLSKLVKLRVLGIDPCCKLNSMPPGLGKLSCLQKLPLFVVGNNNSTSKLNMAHQMEDLKGLTSLKGSLTIKMMKSNKYTMENDGQRGYIQNMQFLRHVEIDFNDQDWEEGLLLEDLKPHSNLRKLGLVNYNGVRMPSWAVEDNLAISLPNLVYLTLQGCTRLEHLPSLRKMSNLKSLEIWGLDELEYIESTNASAIVGDYGAAATSGSHIFFSSLENLQLCGMDKLKGWWREEHITDENSLPYFPRLCKLEIQDCPNLACIPSCPAMEELRLIGRVNENLRIKTASTTESGDSKQRCVVMIPNVGCLGSISPLQVVVNILLDTDSKVESLSEVGETLLSSLSLLQHLQIWECSKLKSVSGLEHLTALESLELSGLPSLSLTKKGEGEEDSDEDDDGMPWRSLAQSLRSLKLRYLDEVVKLPNGMRYLTALQSLHIEGCKNLEAVPVWMSKLTSLETLELSSLSSLSLTSKGRGEKDSDEDEMPWRCLANSLHSLKLSYLPKMVKLPNGMRYLTALHSLKIVACPKLETVPEWMPELTSLKTLTIEVCSRRLHQRCRNPTGEDWPYIRHIPTFTMFMF